MGYEVSLTVAESRRTAVVAARTTWQDFPTLWGQLLGEVWDCLHAGGLARASAPPVVLTVTRLQAHSPRGSWEYNSRLPACR